MELGYPVLTDDFPLVKFFTQNKLEETDQRKDLTKKGALHIKRIVGYAKTFHQDDQHGWETRCDFEKLLMCLSIIEKEVGPEPGTIRTYLCSLKWLLDKIIDDFDEEGGPEDHQKVK